MRTSGDNNLQALDIAPQHLHVRLQPLCGSLVACLTGRKPEVGLAGPVS